MLEKIKKHQRPLMVCLLALCMGVILVGGFYYLHILKDTLMEQSLQNVIDSTTQQRQSFDDFLAGDQTRLHSYAEYFSGFDHSTPEDFQALLALFRGEDAECIVVCMDEGWICGSTHSDILQLSGDDLSTYRGLSGSGVRDNFTGPFSGTPKFSYYEAFTCCNGHSSLIEMCYDRSRILEAFNLSLYNGRGYGYILDQNGDILLCSVPMIGRRPYGNVFDALADTNIPREDVDTLSAALRERETGSILFHGNSGSFFYTYAPLESAENWCMLSIVPMDAITSEADTILHYSRTTLAILLVILLACAALILLIRRTQHDIKEKDKEIAFHERFFNVFTAYLASNTNDVYMVLDHQTEALEYVSPNAERVLGAPPEQVIEALQAYDSDAEAEEREAYFAGVRALAPGQTSPSRTVERVNPVTGEQRYFLENAYRTDILGQSKRMVCISDRTRERLVQNSLTEALHMAQAASEAKTAFLGSVSHDIRTPMNAILGFLTLMKDELGNPEIMREYIQRIESASQHLLGLINDVLDMSKIESGSTTLSLAEMDMADVIGEINAIIRPQSKAKDQSFDIFVSNLKYEHLIGDKMRLNQLLINLLSNAVKYTPRGGSIQLRVEELSQVVDNYSRIRFTVADNGYGMSESYQKVLFEPFTREETKYTNEIQGTGLGMAITKSLVELMGGSIQVESTLGEGSTFTVELELRIQDREDDPGFWTKHKLAKMIVADDDEEICRNIVSVMSRVGVVTDYATDGGAAVRMMRGRREAGQPYDLILLDWKMPDLDGLETARLIRKNYSDNIPILLLTAYDWSEIEAEAIEIGVSHFLPKPFFLSSFKQAVHRVMGAPEDEEGPQQSDVVRGKRILVVDDIDVNRIILVKILGSLGAVCDTASNGREAVDIFERSLPGDYDLILMDVQMPVMDGLTATRAIRGSAHPSSHSVPIIAMTANAFIDDVRGAIEAGMDAHIAKPVQMETLKSTIGQVLEARQAHPGIGNDPRQ